MKGRIFITFKGEGVDTLKPELVRDVTSYASREICRWVEDHEQPSMIAVIAQPTEESRAHKDILTLMHYVSDPGFTGDTGAMRLSQQGYDFVNQVQRAMQEKIGPQPRVCLWLACSLGNEFAQELTIHIDRIDNSGPIISLSDANLGEHPAAPQPENLNHETR